MCWWKYLKAAFAKFKRKYFLLGGKGLGDFSLHKVPGDIQTTTGCFRSFIIDILCQVGISFHLALTLDTTVPYHYQKAKGSAKHNRTTETPFCHKTHLLNTPSNWTKRYLQMKETYPRPHSPWEESPKRVNKSQIYLKSRNFSPKT